MTLSASILLVPTKIGRQSNTIKNRAIARFFYGYNIATFLAKKSLTQVAEIIAASS